MSRRALLSPEQRIRLFGIPVDQAEMARHYVLSAEDLALMRAKRRVTTIDVPRSRAMMLPSGAPLPDAPPCILHRRFPFTAGDWQSFPLRVRAPHRSAKFIAESRCTGLIL